MSEVLGPVPTRAAQPYAGTRMSVVCRRTLNQRGGLKVWLGTQRGLKRDNEQRTTNLISTQHTETHHCHLIACCYTISDTGCQQFQGAKSPRPVSSLRRRKLTTSDLRPPTSDPWNQTAHRPCRKSAHMEKSPLTQQPRPEAFQQKVVRLYEELFKVGVPPLLPSFPASSSLYLLPFLSPSSALGS